MPKKIVSRLPKKPASTPALNGIRVSLFQASGIVHAVRSALDCSDHVEIDEVQLASALEAAGQLIDDAAGQLEGTSNE
jgi:hypothetical protein